MKISQCINLLLDTYNSIDIRTAVYKEDNVWFAALLMIRFRKENEDEVKNEHKILFEKHGIIDEENFKIVFDVLSVNAWKSIIELWGTKSITIQKNFVIHLKKRDFMEPSMTDPYFHKNFSLIDERWKSYHNAQLDNDPTITTAIFNNFNTNARNLRSRDISEFLEKIFQISEYYSKNFPNHIVIAPVFFQINEIEFTIEKVKILCTGFPDDEVHFTLNFLKQAGSNPIILDTIHINHKITGEKNKETDFIVSESLSSNHMDHLFRLDVYRKNGVLLDSETGLISDKFPTKSKFTNPLFEAFKIFVTPEDFRKMILNLESIDLRAPDKIFERGITWLLSLIGCKPVNLQGYEKSGEEPDKVSMDIIANFNDEKIVLANATIGMPDLPMIETERNRRIILSKQIPKEQKIFSVIFTVKPVKDIQEQAKPHEVIVIGKEELENIIDYLENGDIKKAQQIIMPSHNLGF